MLTGDALNYFSNGMSGCTSYYDATDSLKRWYNSEDKRSRILTAWQRLSLSEDMSLSPDSREVSTFRKFVARLRSLEKKLNPNYHSDENLVERLFYAVEIPVFQRTLRDSIPRTSQRTVNRIANQLSEKTRSAGYSSDLLMEDDH